MTVDPTVGTPTSATRVGTLSPYDFAYWATTFVASGAPDDYLDTGPETDGVGLVVWAAQQVGVSVPNNYFGLVIVLSDYIMTIEDALATRGALLVGVGQVAVTTGFDYVVGVINGRYYQYKTTADSALWEHGAMVPGLIYG